MPVSTEEPLELRGGIFQDSLCLCMVNGVSWDMNGFQSLIMLQQRDPANNNTPMNLNGTSQY